MCIDYWANKILLVIIIIIKERVDIYLSIYLSIYVHRDHTGPDMLIL